MRAYFFIAFSFVGPRIIHMGVSVCVCVCVNVSFGRFTYCVLNARNEQNLFNVHFIIERGFF